MMQNDLINGRTPEEIKRGILCSNGCCDCPYAGCISEDETCSEYVERDTLALIERLEATLERLGEFGKLFEEYTGCPRGATGRAALPIEEEVLAMKPIRDVDNGEWIPVNADALRELVAKYKQLRDAVPKWISVKEKTPKDRQIVYMHTSNGRTFKGVYLSHTGFERYKHGDGWTFVNNVIYWTTLPELPKEK